MSYTIQNGEAYQALNDAIQTWKTDGYGVVDVAGGDCVVTVSSGNLDAGDTLSVAPGEIADNGTTVSVGSQTVGINSVGSGYRYDTVWIDSGGTAQVAEGTATQLSQAEIDQNLSRFELFTPTIPFPSTTPATVIAVVAVNETDSSITSSNLQDRRVTAEVTTTSVTSESVDTEALFPETVSDTIYNIAEFPGSTLTQKWDNVRSNLTAGEGYVLIIPPGDTSDPAVNSDGYWTADGPLQFTNTENFGTIIAYDTYIEATSDMTYLVDISDAANKPESIRFYGGNWNAGDSTLTGIFGSTGCSDLVFRDVRPNLFGLGSVQYGFDFDTSENALSDSHWQNVEANGMSDTVLNVDNAGNGISRLHGSNIISGGASPADHVISISGDADNSQFESVVSKSGAVSAVELESTSNGFPAAMIFDGVESSDGLALETFDSSGGAATTMRGISAENLYGQVSGPNVDLDYIVRSDFEVGTEFEPEIVVGADASGINIDTQPSVFNATWTEAAGADRIERNGVGANDGDPTSTGEWNGNGYEGAVVVDTTNSVVYHYRSGAWV